MAPYRSREEARAPKVAPQSGLVADMVRQFADAHAFVRELVQNGIDAGATALDVTADRGEDGVAAVRVADDGCGMTMGVVEDALLVLFRSTKDEDPSKIGKYGVGFMSVFAIEPSEVTVDTWRDGGALRVRLFPDHTYEIEHAAPRDGHGTVVTLVKPLPAGEFEAFWTRVAGALHRWCRHAAVPLSFGVLDAAAGTPARTARADTPFDVRAVISVRQRFDEMEIVVGPIAGSARLPQTGTHEDDPTCFAGFYNRGLTLHETTVELRSGLSDVRVKVNSPRLRHTLSRDDVRRDEPFLVALKRAERMVQMDLRAAVLRELAKEAAKVAALTNEQRTEEATRRFVDLAEVATTPPVRASTTELAMPLASPVQGEAVIRVSKAIASGGLLFTAATTTDLTKALAARGIPVFLAPHETIHRALGRTVGGEAIVPPVEGAFLLARELAGSDRLPGDEALCAWLSEALAPFGIDRVAIGRLPDGDERVAVLIPEPVRGAREHIARMAQSGIQGKWPKGSLLVLREGAEPVACARRATSPSIGAHLLARYLLLIGPGLQSKASEALALRALEEIR
ncbi:MAG: ATP-binding protein [Polyangiaceae bacterium]